MSGRNLSPASSRGLLRRRWPRFEVNGNLFAKIAELDLVMPIRDISLGGLAVETPLRFLLGEVHDLLLCDGDATPQRVRARAAYCHPKRDREHLFITGWEALGDPVTARVMADLVERRLTGRGGETNRVADTVGASSATIPPALAPRRC